MHLSQKIIWSFKSKCLIDLMQWKCFWGLSHSLNSSFNRQAKSTKPNSAQEKGLAAISKIP